MEALGGGIDAAGVLGVVPIDEAFDHATAAAMSTKGREGAAEWAEAVQDVGVRAAAVKMQTALPKSVAVRGGGATNLVDPAELVGIRGAEQYLAESPDLRIALFYSLKIVFPSADELRASLANNGPTADVVDHLPGRIASRIEVTDAAAGRSGACRRPGIRSSCISSRRSEGSTSRVESGRFDEAVESRH